MRNHTEDEFAASNASSQTPGIRQALIESEWENLGVDNHAIENWTKDLLKFGEYTRLNISRLMTLHTLRMERVVRIAESDPPSLIESPADRAANIELFRASDAAVQALLKKAETNEENMAPEITSAKEWLKQLLERERTLPRVWRDGKSPNAYKEKDPTRPSNMISEQVQKGNSALSDGDLVI